MDPETFLFREYLFSLCRDALFWIECERFRTNPKLSRATLIWHAFFAPGADFKLNPEDLTPEQRMMLSIKPEGQSPPPNQYEAAQLAMFNKLKSALQPGFQQSPYYNLISMVGAPNLSSPKLRESYTSSEKGATLTVLLDPNLRPRPGAPPVQQAAPTMVSQPGLPPPVQQHVFVLQQQPAPVAAAPTMPVTAPQPQKATPVVAISAQQSKSAAEMLAETEAQLQQITQGMSSSSSSPASTSPAPQTQPDVSPTQSPLSLSGGASKRPIRTRDTQLQEPAVPGALQQATLGTLRSRVQTLHLDETGPNSAAPKAATSPEVETEVEVEVEVQSPDVERVVLEPVAGPGGIHAGPTTTPTQFEFMAVSSNTTSPNNSRPVSPTPPASSGGPVMFSLANATPTRSQINLPLYSQTAPTTPVAAPTSTPFSTNPPPGDRPLTRSMPPGGRQQSVIMPSSQAKVSAPAGSRSTIMGKEKDKKDKPVPVWMTLEDPILDDVIRDSDFMACFLDYLRTVHAEEILSCWIEIEVYKTAGASDRSGKGKEIVEKYFDPKSRCYISLENVNHSQLLTAVAQRPDRDLFDRPQAQLWELLSLQLYPKFKDSDYFKKLMQENLFHKKHKELMKSKEFRTPGRSGIALHTLDEFLSQSSRPVSIVPNVSEREFHLEDLLYSAELLCAFRDFLQIQSDSMLSSGTASGTASPVSQAAALYANTSGNLGNVLLFWLDAELFKFCPDREIKERAERLVVDYLTTPTSASYLKLETIDLNELQREVAERPNKNSFLAPQMRCWEILQHFFALFQVSDMFSKFFEGTLPVRQSSAALRLFENLQQLRNSIAEKNTFAINLAKVTNKMRAKRQQMEGVVDLETVITEKEWFVCFKDFLSKRQALENLQFWMDAELYRFTAAGERRAAAQTIWAKFFSDTSPHAIHVDVADRQRLLDAMNRPAPGQDLSADLFRAAQEYCWQMLNFDMMPKFQASEHFKKTMAKFQKSKMAKQMRIRAVTKDAVLQMQKWLKEGEVLFGY
eukprot:TRINITY_DN6863_c0_g1_i1.p1 TRINITY_DN6863_c0_g1~~TRINITY_DN6863_c0_g1_i1.p1  ORF type:complete len:1063 (-),score=232.84 TRINITY_DN6863_c0_g1_i1:305-3364(-)